MLTNSFTSTNIIDTIVSGGNIMKALFDTVPITKFNRGQAGKIFGEVKSTNGIKIVMKNNEPEVVLLSPDRYNKLADAYKDMQEFKLYQKVAERIKNDSGITYTHEEVMEKLGLTEQDLEDWEDIELEDVEGNIF